VINRAGIRGAVFLSPARRLRPRRRSSPALAPALSPALAPALTRRRPSPAARVLRIDGDLESASPIHIQRSILSLRGERVILDADLAALYGVETKALVQAVKRNPARFPADFMFQLTPDEYARLRSQTVTSNERRDGRRTAPYPFTEQGVAMLSSVLRSTRAVRVNVEIMRAFVRLRALLAQLDSLLGAAMDTHATISDAHFGASGDRCTSARALYAVLKTVAKTDASVAPELKSVEEWFRVYHTPENPSTPPCPFDPVEPVAAGTPVVSSPR
jgi:hypothetical protein